MSERFKEKLRADFNEILFNAEVQMADPTDPDRWPDMVEELISITLTRVNQHIYELRRSL